MMLCNLNLGSLSQVESLIKMATDVKKLVDTRDDAGFTPLHYAAYYGRFYKSFFTNEMHSKSIQFYFL